MRRSGRFLAFLLALAGAARAEAAAPTVAARLRQVSGAVDERLGPEFRRSGAPYPPRHLFLLAFKEEDVVELWAGSRRDDPKPVLVKRYAVLAASGGPGPKLLEGDLQVPEGFYRVLWLNPASSYHLSMKLDYPNAFDRARGREEGRTRLGGDIFVHGRDVSIGCLALGDRAIEELFVLAARVGVANVDFLIAPRDLRVKPAPAQHGQRPWVGRLWDDLASALRRFPPAPR